jgi:hypothetical protein
VTFCFVLWKHYYKRMVLGNNTITNINICCIGNMGHTTSFETTSSVPGYDTNNLYQWHNSCTVYLGQQPMMYLAMPTIAFYVRISTMVVQAVVS